MSNGAIDGASKTPFDLGNEAWSTGQGLYLERVSVGGKFDTEKYGLCANPYPNGTADHRGWEKGWSAAFDAYLTAVYS
jgi:hypothetical protein